MIYKSLSEIVTACEEMKMPFWEMVCSLDCKEQAVTSKESFETMRKMYKAMKDADESYDPSARSHSGMAGGDGKKLEAYRINHANEDNLLGDFISSVIEKAVKMGESNACMRRIVAAPTAGSCGVIPAVLLAYSEKKNVEEDRLVEALFVAGGIGENIAQNASISGAEGGCQAEIGSASAMAAAMLAYLEGGDNDVILNATALALKNMLGLTCDPVAGLVEVPCIKRNVSGAVNAITSAYMALAGVSSRIPVDEVIDSMRRIGHDMPACVKETGQGGLAITPTGMKITKNLG